MNAVPLLLSLPDGPAQLVPGSFERGQPQYIRDGQLLDIDVTIPPSLQAAGWIWHGSVLYKPGACGVGVCTRSFPPPACFEQAHAIERAGAEMDASARPAPARTRRRRAAVESSEHAQTELV